MGIPSPTLQLHRVDTRCTLYCADSRVSRVVCALHPYERLGIPSTRLTRDAQPRQGCTINNHSFANGY
eukprot:4876549-Prymnesium_polylepis.1